MVEVREVGWMATQDVKKEMKLSCSQAEPGQANTSAVVKFPPFPLLHIE